MSLLHTQLAESHKSRLGWGAIRKADHLHEVVAEHLLVLLEGFLIVELAWGRLFLLICHDFVSEGRAGRPHKLAGSSLDVTSPVRVLNVLGSWKMPEVFGVNVSKVLQLRILDSVSEGNPVLVVYLGRGVVVKSEGVGTLGACDNSN